MYIKFAIPSDQLDRDPITLSTFVAAFNGLTGLRYDSSTILKYIFNRRKAKDWPKLGSKAKKFKPVTKVIPPEHIPVLKIIYEEINQTVDNIKFDKDLSRQISKMFLEKTGLLISGSKLAAFIMSKRKRGEWVTICEKGAFTDYNKVSNEQKQKRA